MITGINHVAISTRDLDTSISFYRDLMGMDLVSSSAFEGELFDNIMGLKNARGRSAMLKIGHSQLELFEFAHPQAKGSNPDRPVCDHGITHFCFDVTDIDAEYERLTLAGVPFHCPPQDAGFAKATYGRDPDGNVFELFELKD